MKLLRFFPFIFIRLFYDCILSGLPATSFYVRDCAECPALERRKEGEGREEIDVRDGGC